MPPLIDSYSTHSKDTARMLMDSIFVNECRIEQLPSGSTVLVEDGHPSTQLNEKIWHLYRIVPKNYLNPDGTATSRVFKLREKDEGRLSVDVKSMTTPEKSIADSSRFLLFEILNQTVLQFSLETIHDPLLDGSNDAHAVILGLTMEDDILPGMLARNSQRVRF